MALVYKKQNFESKHDQQPWIHMTIPLGNCRHETPVLSKPIEVIHLSEDLVVLDKPCSLPVSDIIPTLLLLILTHINSAKKAMY